MPIRPSDERGFSMIELMIVVLIIGVLLAIALPVFLGAQRRANDGAVKTDVRNTFLAERVYFADGETYTQDPGVLETIESFARTPAWNAGVPSIGATTSMKPSLRLVISMPSPWNSPRVSTCISR